MLLLGYGVVGVFLLVTLCIYDVAFLILLKGVSQPRALKRLIGYLMQHTSLFLSLDGHQSLHHPDRLLLCVKRHRYRLLIRYSCRSKLEGLLVFQLNFLCARRSSR